MVKTNITIRGGFRVIRAACALTALLATPGGAQVDPGASWRTLRTEHFSVTFTPELEELARRVAARAEEAYAGLARQLRPPRGPIDIVIADNVDYSNGYATPFSTRTRRSPRTPCASWMIRRR